jgi:hypothetical protein
VFQPAWKIVQISLEINGGVANGASGSTNSNGNAGNVGLAIGPISQANGDPGSNANGGGFAINGGDTNGGGFAINGGQTLPGCNVAIGQQCFNQPGG